MSVGVVPLRVALATAYCVVLFYFGVIDVGVLPPVPVFSADKLLHALCFCGLTLLVEWGLVGGRPAVRASLGVGVSAGVGALLELVQSALPHRSAEWADLVADALGAGLGALLVFGVGRWRRPTSAAEARQHSS